MKFYREFLDQMVETDYKDEVITKTYQIDETYVSVMINQGMENETRFSVFRDEKHSICQEIREVLN